MCSSWISASTEYKQNKTYWSRHVQNILYQCNTYDKPHSNGWNLREYILPSSVWQINNRLPHPPHHYFFLLFYFSKVFASGYKIVTWLWKLFSKFTTLCLTLNHELPYQIYLFNENTQKLWHMPNPFERDLHKHTHTNALISFHAAELKKYTFGIVIWILRWTQYSG